MRNFHLECLLLNDKRIDFLRAKLLFRVTYYSLDSLSGCMRIWAKIKNILQG